MKTLFKILLYLTGLVVALVVIAAIVIPLYVDPNDYKEEMAKAVQEHTGRKLSIDGDIGLSVFPWLGIELGKVALGNAAGFKEPVFAGAERVDIRVKLLPLLSKQLEMNTVSVHGLRINLARDKQGRTNWEDLSQPAGKGSKPAPTEETSGIGDAPPIGALAIGGVDVQDAQIRWRDEQAGQQLAIEGFTLHTGAIVPGKPIDLDLKFHLRGSQPQVDGDLTLQGQIDLDLESQRYRIKNLTLNSQFSGEAVSGKTLKTELVTEVDLNLQQQTLTLPKLSLKTLGMAIQGALSVERVLTEPQFNASLDVAEFSPKGLMEQLGMPAVQTADPQVLTKASLKTRIKGSTTQVKLAPLTLHLDDTTLEGYVALPRFKGPTLRFDLAVNAIDADRYLPPGKTAGSAPPSATPGAAATSASGEVPLEPLRTLDMDGRLRIGKLKISKLSIQDVVVKLTGKQGLIKLDPIAAQLYEGNYDGHIHFDARGKQPKVSVNEKLVGVQAGPLLKDMLGEERLTGTAKLNAKLSTTGLDADTARAKLNGNVNFSFMEGAVKGINIGQMIREAKAKLKGEPATPSEEEAKTDFSELSGSIKLVNGLASNDDLQAKSPLLRIKGKGKVDLVKEQIDYLLTTVIVGTSKGQGGSELDDLKGVPIPVKVTGTFQDPSYSPALGEVLKGKATQEVKQKAKKKLEEKLGDKAKGLFKGLFD